jgi:EAL domain-containing protein (putative c-di-GMP-specific phosphodiesterase class I)
MVAISNLARAQRLIRKLRRYGCGFSLDHFGTGVNSSSYLKALPVTCVKIDGSFTRDLLSNNGSDAAIHTIAQLSKSLEIECVAEQVETMQESKRLQELGVDYIQGYVAHRPQALHEVLEAVKNAAAARLHEQHSAR